ncbi:hypothetical protein [Streptomyces gilvifuscus]|uniref:hypothetical protein n=1 Tax=Streptomyces gilvifuscus TaxID=1550617 RepID=UPI002FEDF158
MPHHALESTLTRPLSANALRRASRELPIAANHDATRLIALMPAKTPTGPSADCATGSGTSCLST